MKIKKKEAGIDFAKAAVAANFCETDPPAETRLPSIQIVLRLGKDGPTTFHRMTFSRRFKANLPNTNDNDGYTWWEPRSSG